METWYKREYLEAWYQVVTKQKETRARNLIKKAIRTVEDKRIAVTLSGKDSLTALGITASVAQEESFEFDVVISRYFVDRVIPHIVVEELKQIAQQFTKNVVIYDERWGTHANFFDLVAKKFGYNIVISGIRRAENGPHHLEIEHYKWGLLINPILHWALRDVWAFLAHYKIRVPEAYSQSVVPWARLQDLLFD